MRDEILDSPSGKDLEMLFREQLAETRLIRNHLQSIENMLAKVYERSEEQAESFARTEPPEQGH